MGWRFRKSVRFGPLLRLNLSKTGTSWSIGRPGMTVNVGRGRAKATIGAPGSGLSYSESTRLEALGDEPAEEPKRKGFFARMFGRSQRGR